MHFEGDHNSPRPKFFFDSVVIFFYNTLQVEALLTADAEIKRQKPKNKVDFNDADDSVFFDDMMSQQMLY